MRMVDVAAVVLFIFAISAIWTGSIGAWIALWVFSSAIIALALTVRAMWHDIAEIRKELAENGKDDLK